jgi:hypothetical protein
MQMHNLSIGMLHLHIMAQHSLQMTERVLLPGKDRD